MSIPRKLVHNIVAKVEAAMEEDRKTKAILYEAAITEKDREIVRAHLLEAAEHIRKNYDLVIPVIRSFLHEMVDVSV